MVGKIGSLVRPDALGQFVWINRKGLGRRKGYMVCTKTDYTQNFPCSPENDLLRTGIHYLTCIPGSTFSSSLDSSWQSPSCQSCLHSRQWLVWQ